MADYAARGAAYALSHGVAPDQVVPLPAPKSLQERTCLNAADGARLGRAIGVALDAVDLMSAGMHARRSRALYARALGERVEVGVIAAAPTEFDAALVAQQRRDQGRARRIVSWLWTSCCFWPDPHVVVSERPNDG